MKAFTLTAIIAMLATTVVADNCKTGLNYCGSTLLRVGNYRDQISQALAVAGHPNWSGDNVLFECLGGSGGAIRFIGGCGGGCADAGSGKSDFCR
ncbi:hypothetical protein B0J11DRAFT_73539 [Dendryphion nanum]|uniref:Uncharacterized protein n=1 Tax=Dendryphion nanum TaxID=256645 RepID=A0A9P9IFK0_9PLEO|nr:hypothetical protein B0J11DRAFT_73539 [Dendryphion nanum]